MKENLVEQNAVKKQKPKVIAVVGPTASGKTDYALALAEKISGEIVSADSRLVYKGFDIGTAKPTIEERKSIPHYMIDIVEPEVDYSAGLYVEEATRMIDNIIGRDRVPIVVGGTGLYFRLLLENYDVPKIEPDYEFRDMLRDFPAEELYKMLKAKDPQRAEEIEQNDRKKIIRALEMSEHLEKPLSEYKKEPLYDVQWIGLNFERSVLYERINRRVDIMVESGLIDETKLLLEQHGHIKNLVCTIGYQEMLAYLDGILTLDEAKDKLKQNTRNYAKRQLTWFRKNKDIKWNIEPVKLKK